MLLEAKLSPMNLGDQRFAIEIAESEETRIQGRLSGPMWRHYARSLECEHRLAEVIGQMVGAAQHNGEAIARSIFREIFF